MGGGRAGGKPGESNEEAMLRMTGGKGKGKAGKSYHSGKGGKGGPPPSVDEIPEARRAALRSDVEAFAAGSEPQLALPASLNGLERKFVHTLCEEFGLSSQSFGKGTDRKICILRPEPSAACAAGNAAVEEGEEARLDRKTGEEEKLDGAKLEALQVDPRTVTYSAVLLDAASRERLREFCARTFNVPSGWTPHGEHLTICMGPLSDPKTLDTRSVGDIIRQQVALLRDRQEMDLQVISTGRSESAMAVGVMGCASCNRNPHITVATEPGMPPVSSNEIPKWDMLPVDLRISLHGMVWQRSQQRREDPPPWAWARACPTSAAPAAANQALAAAVRLSKAVLWAQHENKPRSVDTLRSFLKPRALHLQVYTLHPAKLAEALGSALPAAVVQALEMGLRPPAEDPLDCFGRPEEVPADVLARVRRDLVRIQQCGAPSVPACARWITDQAMHIVSVSAETTVEELEKAGALSVDAEGTVNYAALGDESVAEARAALHYSRPWPMEGLPRLEWEVLHNSEWESLPGQATRLIREALKRGKKTTSYVATKKEGRVVRKTAYTLDLESMQRVHDETGWRDELRKTGF